MYKEQTCAFSIYTDKIFALSQHEKLTDENGNKNIKAVKILIPLVHEAEQGLSVTKISRTSRDAPLGGNPPVWKHYSNEYMK
jgi:hypothetical protein